MGFAVTSQEVGEELGSVHATHMYGESRGIVHVNHANTTDICCRGVLVEQEKLMNPAPNPTNDASQQYILHTEGAVGIYNLGLLYAQGKVMPQDKAKAAELYAKAHAAGFAKATYNLALMYQRGEGVEQDSVKAAEFYEQAHAKGYSKATYNLGRMYERGEGVERDSVKAAELFEQLTKEKTGDVSLRTRLKKNAGKPILAFNVTS
jgi:hypothetical protein